MNKDELRRAAHAQIDTAVAFIIVSVNDAGTALHAHLNGTPEEGLILSGMCQQFAMVTNAAGAQGILVAQRPPNED